jgi:hypothetical protein
LVTNNSPVILTAIGVTGVVTTAILTGKATIKAVYLLEEEAMHREQPISDKETFELVWKLYIPAAGTGLLTIVAIIFADRIGSRRAAAVAAAYTITEKAFAEYRGKIVEKLGNTKEQSFRDEIAQDRVDRNPPDSAQVIIAGGGSVLCFDSYTGRYFLSDLETIKQAQNTINYRILHDSYASLSDFYERVGLPSTAISDNVGWNSDKQVELNFSATITESGKPCIVIDFHVMPIHNFDRFNI